MWREGLSWRALALSAPILLFGWLGASYLPGPITILFRMLVGLPILSAVLMILTAVKLGYSHEFSTDHPIKGEAVDYRVRVSAGSFPFPTPVGVWIEAGRTGDEPRVTTYLLVPPSGRSATLEARLECPVRGVYKFGLARLRVYGLFRAFWIDLPVWKRTFYVYPRLFQLSPGAFRRVASAALTGGVSGPQLALETAVRGVVPYRPGISLNHVSWKRFASLGFPVMNEFDTGSRRLVYLALDTREVRLESTSTSRHNARTSFLRAEVEDCSVEVLLSVLKALVDDGYRVVVVAPGWTESGTIVRSASAVTRLRELSVGLFFRGQTAPGTAIAGVRTDEATDTILVTHRWDLDAGGRTVRVTRIFNTVGWAPGARARLERHLASGSGGRMQSYVVGSADNLARELASWQ